MPNSNAAIHHGFAFQARIFWQQAIKLLRTGNAVVRLGFEWGPKGFDDLWIEYAPGRGPKDQFGHPIQREYVQCKWHEKPKKYDYIALTSPAFINATTQSFLQRALAAQRTHAPDGAGVRFALQTNWQVAEPLLGMIHQKSYTLDLKQLFFGQTERSKAGKIRAC
jgi:hypothetical protein